MTGWCLYKRYRSAPFVFSVSQFQSCRSEMKQALFTVHPAHHICMHRFSTDLSNYLEIQLILRVFRGGSYIENGNVISKFTLNNIRECAPIQYISLYLQFGVHVQVSILFTRDTIFPIQECLIRNCSDNWEIRNCLHRKMSVYRCQQYIIFLYNAILKNNKI